MMLRQFNPDGIQAFRAFLAVCREKPDAPAPAELLDDFRMTQLVVPPVEIEKPRLLQKADAATYLAKLLGQMPEQHIVENVGLWTWLTLFFFDDICRAQDGVRTLKNDYCYVFEPKNSRHYYRHLLFLSWRILTIAPKHHRLFLTGPIATLDSVTMEVMKRLYLTRIPCIFEVLDRLYWNDASGKARKGIVGQQIRPGDLSHRLPLRIRQLEKTYDLMSLTADQLLELLGDEFEEGADVGKLFKNAP
jgi:hypothetical protein